jgi:hypothetical protein
MIGKDYLERGRATGWAGNEFYHRFLGGNGNVVRLGFEVAPDARFLDFETNGIDSGNGVGVGWVVLGTGEAVPKVPFTKLVGGGLVRKVNSQGLRPAARVSNELSHRTNRDVIFFLLGIFPT